MRRALCSRWLTRAFQTTEALSPAGLPLFLCPAVDVARKLPVAPVRISRSIGEQRLIHTGNSAPKEDLETAEINSEEPRKLPVACTGCGAFTQTTDSQQLGYYDVAAKRVRQWLAPPKHELQQKSLEENEVINNVLSSMDSNQLTALGFDASTLVVEEPVVAHSLDPKPPVCDRCHDLIHHNAKSPSGRVPMFHPTVESLRETIEESPHKYNHIYHVIDAADFPMSLIPRLNVLLGDIPLRTRNRRSRADKFLRDRQTELSFIITRGDLLGPTKQSVDALMPYLREVLRDALGRLGSRVRLGNVRCVSASHGWWTRDVREDIWNRGGAGWMVGKVNVGKSRLFEEVYPKGRLNHPEASVGPTVIGHIAPRQEDTEVGVFSHVIRYFAIFYILRFHPESPLTCCETEPGALSMGAILSGISLLYKQVPRRLSTLQRRLVKRGTPEATAETEKKEETTNKEFNKRAAETTFPFK